MADFRVWYASRDPYHCIFRLIRILVSNGKPMPIEQLRVLDMFLIFPVLLHRLSLPEDIKERFRKLKIETPAKFFVRLPSNASIWQDLQIYQSTAMKQLTGLGLLNRDSLRDHLASLDASLVPDEVMERVSIQNQAAAALMRLLTNDIASLPMSGNSNLFKRAGLPARGPVL